MKLLKAPYDHNSLLRKRLRVERREDVHEGRLIGFGEFPMETGTLTSALPWKLQADDGSEFEFQAYDNWKIHDLDAPDDRE